MDQEKFCFGRTVVPCDYEAPLAQFLGEKSCVVIKAYNGKKNDKGSKQEVQEEFVK